MYYNYHALAKGLIAQGHLVKWEFLAEYNAIKPCLLLHFDNHKPMPLREYRWNDYLPLIKNAGWDNVYAAWASFLETHESTLN